MLPAGSVAVAFTEVVPTEKKLPGARLYVILAEQLSVAVAAKLTLAPHSPGVLFTEIFAGQVITGF